MTLQLSTFAIEPFNKNEITWARWVERLESAFEVFKVEDTKIKLHLLLHYMGQTAYNILSDKIAPEKAGTKDYKEITKLLDQHFNPTPLEIVENYRFHLRKQKDGESVEEFLVELRRLSINCKFEGYLNTALRNQFVFGLSSQKIQNRLLETVDLTLENAQKTAISMELSAKGGAEIHVNNNSNVYNIRQTSSRRDTSHQNYTSNPGSSGIGNVKLNKNMNLNLNNKIACYRCGNESHLANKCIHSNSVCLYCNKRGHLKRVCFKAKSDDKNSANFIVDEKDENFDRNSNVRNEMQMEELCNIDSGKEGRSKVWLTLNVNNKDINFEIDSGSPVSLISRRDSIKYFENMELKKSDTELTSYCNNKIEIFGYIDAVVKPNIGNKKFKLYVGNSNKHPLLGREWLRNLNLNWNQILGNTEINKIDDGLIQNTSVKI